MCFDQRRWRLNGEKVVVKMDDLGRLTDDLGTLGFKSGPASPFEQTFHGGKYGIIARLEHLATNEQIVFVNTHLSWEEEYEFVKLCQVHYLMLKLEEFTRYWLVSDIVFCGDLNALPGSMVHKYLTQGGHNDYDLERKLRFGGMGHDFDHSGDYGLAVSKWLL